MKLKFGPIIKNISGGGDSKGAKSVVSRKEDDHLPNPILRKRQNLAVNEKLDI